MIDLRAAVGIPCTTCRFIVLVIILSILPLSHYHGLEETDFFGLRHYMGSHVPPAVDVILVFPFVAGIWILCERVVADYFLHRKSTRGDKGSGKPRGPAG